MERTFNVYEFNGVILHLCTCDKVRKMSLKDCLDQVYNTYYDRDTKRFFNSYNLDFIRHELTVNEINNRVAHGWALFAISEKTDINEVRNYIKLGLKPVFMKYSDLRALRKVYG